MENRTYIEGFHVVGAQDVEKEDFDTNKIAWNNTNDAFRNCKKLSKVTFKGNTIKSIGKNAFRGCKKIDSVYVPRKMQYKKLLEKAGYVKNVKGL